MRRWGSAADLAKVMTATAQAGRHVRLTPETAIRVAHWISCAEKRPSRDDVAILLCHRKESERCSQPCYSCIAKANIVVDAYGERPVSPVSKASAAVASNAMKMGDLRRWHLLTYRCREVGCRHEVTVQAHDIAKRFDRAMPFTDFEARVRCVKCERADVALIVSKMPR